MLYHNIDIDHIFSNESIYFLNFIFYFSLNGLPFDFLIPYENKTDREYLSDNYLEKKINEDESKLDNKYNELTLSVSSCNNFSFN